MNRKHCAWHWGVGLVLSQQPCFLTSWLLKDRGGAAHCRRKLGEGPQRIMRGVLGSGRTGRGCGYL